MVSSVVGPSVPVGCSRGGQIAFDAAIQHPERVDALVLVGSAPAGGPEVPAGASVAPLGEAIEEAESAGDLATVNELEARLWLDGAEAPPGRVAGSPRELFLSMNGAALEAVPPGDTRPFAEWDRLHELAVPTLLIVGALDLPPLVKRMEAMAQVIPDSELIVLEESAHLPMLDSPGEVAAHLMEFLTRAV